MSDDLSKRIEEIDRIFGRFLSKVESALRTRYAFPSEYLGQMEDCLRVWFRGFARRPGSPTTEEGTLPHIFLMTCQAGQVFWAAQEKVAEDENLKRSLELGPYQIAIELEKETQENRDGKDDGSGAGEKGS